MKKLALALIIHSLIASTPAQAAPEFNQMSNQIFGDSGVIVKAYEWGFKYITGASALILSVGLVGYWLKALKD